MAADDPVEEPASGRAEGTDLLWSDTRVDPVEIALPGGVGYTLRAYRTSTELARAEIDRDDVELDDFDAASAAVARRRRPVDVDEEGEPVEVEAPPPAATSKPTSGKGTSAAKKKDKNLDENLDHELEDDFDEDEYAEDELAEDPDLSEFEDDEESDEAVPTFLGRNGRLYLFHSPEKLVEFIRSGAENDLSQLDTWTDLTERISVDDVVALDEDSYELDLVVENLRGGPDAWDPPLILKAGEVARDLGYALRLEAVLQALSPGSPLDDLDEALRTGEDGGVSGFFAKRKLRKIPAQQTSLAWRTVIGKISAAADWRD